MIRTFINNIAPLLLLAFLPSCEHHKDLEPYSDIASEVEVVFDWTKAPDHKAQSMALFMYPEGRDMVQHWFNNTTGGIIKTHALTHTAVCMNNDNTFSLYVRNHQHHEDIEIYTGGINMLVGQGISSRGLPRAEGTETEPLRSVPEQCWGTHARDIRLTATTHRQSFTLYPEELVCHYTVEFPDVKNLKSADLRIDATITSMAGGVLPGRLSTTPEKVTHNFTLSPDEELTSLSSSFLTFGVPDCPECPHMICLYILLRDNTGNFYTYDVSDQVNKAPDPRHVHIIIRGLELPEVKEPTGGLGVTIDNWNTEYIDLPM